MNRQINHEEIINLIINTNDFQQLRDLLKKYHPYDIAIILTNINEEYREKLYAVFSNEEIADIFSYIDPEETIELIEDIKDEKLADIINEMEPDDAADILAEFESEKAQVIINLLEQESQTEIKALTAYDEDTAGAIMNSNYIEIESGNDVKDVMKKIVKEAPNVETINTSFVIDESGNLLGTLDLKKIIVTKSPKIVDEIMNSNFHYVNVNDKLDTVIKAIGDYDIYAMPVLDNGILKGIITMDDAFDTLSQEAEEDYAKLAGLTESEKTDESTIQSVKKRLPWLSIFLVMDIFVAVITAAYDYLFESLTILVIFQPIILGLAGNCGTQSLAVTVRKISRYELEKKNGIIKHLTKEIILGLITGIILGLCAFVFSGVLLQIKKELEIPVLQVGIVVGLAIFISLTVANLFGALIPILLYKIKIDPAVASGPLITTLIDILSVVIYFSLATFLIYSNLK